MPDISKINNDNIYSNGLITKKIENTVGKTINLDDSKISIISNIYIIDHDYIIIT